MVGDQMDALDDPDLEEAADEEVRAACRVPRRRRSAVAVAVLTPRTRPATRQVEKVLYDITAGELGKLPEKGGGALVSDLPDTVSEEEAERFIAQLRAT